MNSAQSGEKEEVLTCMETEKDLHEAVVQLARILDALDQRRQAALTRTGH
jgi:hypothetical protein